MATQMSKKRKFVADGVFFAELNEVLTRELAEDGYSGVEVRVTPMRTEIIIRATRTQAVLGEKGRRIRELTSVVQKRFKFPENSVELYAEKVNNRGLCAIAQAESLRYKLLGGLAVRRACYGVLRFVMESGAKGCEVIVSGKLRAQRAKSMKFKDGYMISSGQPVKDYIDSAVRHVLLRQGVLGIKVKIMLDWDPKGKQGPKTPLPDLVTIHTPKEEEEYARPAAVLATNIELLCFTHTVFGAESDRVFRTFVRSFPVSNMASQMSKKRKFVADGVFFAELNEVLTRELAEDGYSGVEVRVTPMRTEIIIRATRTQAVLGEKGRRIRELTSVVQKRFKFPENSVELYAEKVNNRGLCAIAQAESLRYKLLGGLAVRRACYGVLRFVMESGAKGCEVIVSGKLRAQRAKSMKFKDGYMISSGQPVKDYIDSAVRHVLLRQGVLGIKVKIMLDWDPKGKQGPKTPLPDLVTIHTPKEEEEYARPAAVLATDIEVPVA
ncbi:40S ribosomal protein S3-3 [Glycine max]|nr:40S ribosomal protein S3-3 [Glycine max]